MKLTVNANDSLHFGRGKSTSAGEASFGFGMFPPYPTVLHGALRGAFLSQNPRYIEHANEPGYDPTLEYKMTFYSMLLDGNLHFPAPMDLFAVENETELIQCGLKENDGMSSLKRELYYLWVDQKERKISNPEGRYISACSLGNYLCGKCINVHSVKLSDYFQHEERIGLARDSRSRTSADHMLYNAIMIRLKDAAFAAKLEGPADRLPDAAGVIRLGKHGKTAKYAAADFNDAMPHGNIKNGLFKLYFATPAVFNDNFAPELPGSKLIALAINGYENVGGYDIKANRPKTTLRAVSAGSVFYYRLADCSDENCSRIIETLHGKCISQEYGDAGLGLCYVGTVKLPKED